MRRRNDRSAGRRWDDSMEKEYEESIEERIEAQQRRLDGKEKTKERTKKKSAGKNTARNKAPLLLRILTWCGVILFCFVMGYLGTSYVLKRLDEQRLLKPDEANPGPRELEILLSADRTADGLRDIQKKTLSLFYPKEGVLTEEKTEIIAGTFEDDIRDVVHRLVERSGLFGGDVRVKHVFRDTNLVYLDFSGPFASGLSAAGEKISTLFITGIVRTMRDDFSIVRVRFLLDSRVANDGAPVNLTATWQLPQ
jgi:hypothetical protein